MSDPAPPRIPKIIHQLWIGDQSKRPQRLMDTWREMNPTWEYILWTEEEIARRGIVFECQDKINDIWEINGKADIMRWEILYQIGGVFLDADSISIAPLDEELFLVRAARGFSIYENEVVRKGLVCCGAMGFPAGHPLLRELMDTIKQTELRPQYCNLKAWCTVACVPLTKALDSGRYPDFTVFPSYMFVPHHFTGARYQGHKKVFGHQVWGSTYHNYGAAVNAAQLPVDLREPPGQHWVSVLVSSYNTPASYIYECLESIKSQIGYFGIELVWINDGSDQTHTSELEAALLEFENTTRFTRVIYRDLCENFGIAKALHEGVKLCTCDYIVKMDSDDVMHKERIARQLEFMRKTADCVACGANIQFFRGTATVPQLGQKTNHPAVVKWTEFARAPKSWFMNHPTMCVRRAAVLEVGNYNLSLTKSPFEDFELEIRLLKKYGRIYNMGDVLLFYRLHDNQVTHKMNADPEKWGGLRERIIRTHIEGGGAAGKISMNF
jgi:mannosyltransferase OCH1-like enzyme/glycosyltransferase involved in cell wall biosynthesis